MGKASPILGNTPRVLGKALLWPYRGLNSSTKPEPKKEQNQENFLTYFLGAAVTSGMVQIITTKQTQNENEEKNFRLEIIMGVIENNN